jgi:hypothetical protein
MAAMPQGFTSKQDANQAIVQASFDRWRSGTGGPFEIAGSRSGVDDSWFISLVKDLSQSPRIPRQSDHAHWPPFAATTRLDSGFTCPSKSL